MKDNQIPEKIVKNMMENDYFSQWLGIEVLETSESQSRLSMLVRKDMLNGFGILHGGITYSLADSALAFASNAHNKKCVSIETSISHIESCRENDLLFTEVKEIKFSGKTGIYIIEIKNQHQQLVALFKGTVYITEKNWL